jgi:hypothetical protein
LSHADFQVNRTGPPGCPVRNHYKQFISHINT